MIPLILVAIGGYFIADSILETEKFKDGGETEESSMEYYIDYLNKEKGFKKDRKYFKTYNNILCTYY